MPATATPRERVGATIPCPACGEERWPNTIFLTPCHRCGAEARLEDGQLVVADSRLQKTAPEVCVVCNARPGVERDDCGAPVCEPCWRIWACQCCLGAEREGICEDGACGRSDADAVGDTTIHSLYRGLRDEVRCDGCGQWVSRFEPGAPAVRTHHDGEFDGTWCGDCWRQVAGEDAA